MNRALRFAANLPTALVMAGVSATALPADTPSSPATLDSRVAAALQGAGQNYVDDGGDFQLNLTLDGGRTQRAWVASATARAGNLELRDVWSVAYRAPGAISLDLARLLLRANAGSTLGAWQVNQNAEEFLVVFSAPIAADADAAALRETVAAVARTADRMEQELGGEDRY